MSLKIQTTEQALRVLRAVGAKFIVVDPAGATHMHGDLRLAEPEPERKRKQHVPMGTYHKIYHPVVRDMQPGSSGKIIVPEGLDIEGLRGSLTAWCSKNWEAGNYCTQIEGRTIEVLRV